jgi:hypothetical protein
MFDPPHDHPGDVLIDLELSLQVLNRILVEEYAWFAVYEQVLGSQHSYP